MTEQLKAYWKKLLSYTKARWDLDDYPLRYYKQAGATEQNNTRELKLWVVQIINWWLMTGLGNTKQEAYENLKENFINRLKNKLAPRPGTNVLTTYVSTFEIDKMEDIAPGFFEQILNLNYYDCFVSDNSSLNDFGKNDEETLQSINAIYNLGLPGLDDGNIVRLLTLIKENTK